MCVGIHLKWFVHSYVYILPYLRVGIFLYNKLAFWLDQGFPYVCRDFPFNAIYASDYVVFTLCM